MKKQQLYFNRPAVNFLESIPFGNGRLGGMVYGELMREQVILNESSVWSGKKEETDRQDAHQYLPEIRRLLAEGKNYEAEQLFAAHFTCRGKGSNYGHGADAPFGCYQVLGRLQLSYFQALSTGREGCYAAGNYRRCLDLETGVVSTEFDANGLRWRREWIASRTHNALYLQLTAGKPGEGAKQNEVTPVEGKIHVTLGLDRDERFWVEVPDEDTLLMTGQLEDGEGGTEGVRYACCVSIVRKGGSSRTNGLRIGAAGADSVTVIVTARTNLSDFMGRTETDERGLALADMQAARRVAYEEARAEYTKWYGSQAKAMELELWGESRNADLPTPERIARFNAGEADPGLIALYVQYARHLMISSSQKGDLPANLQGIWSEEVQTPWNGDWHLNAQQQIYWLVEKTGLSDNHLPFLELTRELAEPGAKTAKAYYNARGWVVHTMTNPRKMTSPMENAAWGSTVTSAAWQCHHLFEHYLYTQDKAYLQEFYPVMKGAAQFFMDLLVEDPRTGYLVTSPSSSPENHFFDEQGRDCALCEGPAYDRELVSSLAEYCIQAQYVLQDDPEFMEELKALLPRLAPVEIGSDGRIMEWGREYREALPFHRHLSHLWSVYPGYQISREKTPKLAQAAELSLLHRGTTTAGWAVAYRSCVAARLRNAEAAYGYLQNAFHTSVAPNLMNLAYHCDETKLHHDVPDFNSCVFQFQLDGNQANASAVLLMLLDDDARILEDGSLKLEVFLLPALPMQLADGKAKGLRTKGGLRVDLEWREGCLTEAKIVGRPGQEFTLHYCTRSEEIVLDENGAWIYQA